MQNRTKRIIKLNQTNYENVKNIRHRSRGKFKMFSLLIYWVSFPYLKRHALFVTNLVSVTKTKEQERIRRHEIRGQSNNSRVKKSRLIWFLFIFLLFLQLHSYIQSLLLKLVQFSVIWVVAGLCGPNGSEMRHFWSCLVQKGICLFQISIPCIQLLIKCITRVEIEKTIGGF